MYAALAFKARLGAQTTVVVLETATESPNQSPRAGPEPASSASCLPAGGAASWPATAHAGPVFVIPANPAKVPPAATAGTNPGSSASRRILCRLLAGSQYDGLAGDPSRPSDTQARCERLTTRQGTRRQSRTACLEPGPQNGSGDRTLTRRCPLSVGAQQISSRSSDTGSVQQRQPAWPALCRHQLSPPITDVCDREGFLALGSGPRQRLWVPRTATRGPNSGCLPMCISRPTPAVGRRCLQLSSSHSCLPRRSRAA